MVRIAQIQSGFCSYKGKSICCCCHYLFDFEGTLQTKELNITMLFTIFPQRVVGAVWNLRESVGIIKEKVGGEVEKHTLQTKRKRKCTHGNSHVSNVGLDPS